MDPYGLNEDGSLVPGLRTATRDDFWISWKSNGDFEPENHEVTGNGWFLVIR
jgi:hypothetical protein